MFKRLLIGLCFSIPLLAQVSDPKALVDQKGPLASIPTNCQDGQLFFATDQSVGQNIYGCRGNTWSLQGNAGSGSSLLQTGNITGLCTSDNNQRYYWTNASGASYSIPPAPSGACAVVLQNNDSVNALSITNAGSQTVNGQTSGLTISACPTPTTGCPVKVLSYDVANSVWIFGNPTTPGASGAGYSATSTTSFTVGTGSKTFTTQSGLAYISGSNSYATVCSSGTPSACMTGPVTSYSGTSLIINVTSTTGSGTHTDWLISVSGIPGTAGSNGTNGAISVIQNQGTSLPVEPKLNMIGTAVSCADDSVNTRTSCTVTAGQSVYPSTSTLGTLVGGFSSGGVPFNSTHQTCAAGKLSFWPVSGWFVSASTAIATSETLAGYAAVAGCLPSASSVAASIGTTMTINIPPGGTTGGYTNTFPYDGLHVNAGSQVTLPSSLTGTSAIDAAFIADSGQAVTVFGSAPQVTLTLSSTQYFSFGHTSAVVCATELNCSIPIPVAGQWSLFSFCSSTIPTNTTAVAFRVNSASAGTPSTIGGTSGTSVGCNLYDTADSYTSSAGDYVDVQTITGIGTPINVNWFAVGFTPTTGTPEILWTSINGTVAATQTYGMPTTGATSTTFTSAEQVVPRACTASRLYATQAANNGAGISTTYALYRATGTTGTPTITALTGTIATGAGSGSTAVDNSDTVSLAAGDRISFGYVAAGGTSPTIGGISAICQ